MDIQHSRFAQAVAPFSTPSDGSSCNLCFVLNEDDLGLLLFLPLPLKRRHVSSCPSYDAGTERGLVHAQQVPPKPHPQPLRISSCVDLDASLLRDSRDQ